MKKEYIFIGGPLDLQSKVTDGYMYHTCIETIKPLKASTYVDQDHDAFTNSFAEHRYNLTDVYCLGVPRQFYVSSELKPHEAEKKIGLFIASLIDLYAQS